MHRTMKRQKGAHKKQRLLLSFVYFSFPQTVGTNVIYEMTRGAWLGIEELVGYDLIRIG